jgi:hypothetical protein
MSSVFNTTATLYHRTPLPSTATLEDGVAVLRDHDFLIKLDPEFVKYTTDTAPANSDPATKFYTVTDHMDALPAGLWDTTVSFKAEITDIPTGVKWVIKAPLGLTQLTMWTIEPAVAPETGFCLVEDIQITCSRLLVGTVKGKCEANYPGVHRKIIEKVGSIANKN